MHLWRARDLGEKLCNSAAHAQPNSFRTNATKLIKLIKLTASNSSHFPCFSITSCFVVSSLPYFVCLRFLSLFADVIFVDLSSEV